MGELPVNNGNSIRYRIDRLEREVDEIKRAAISEKLAVLGIRLATLAEELKHAREEASADNKELRKGFRNVSFSIIGGLVILAIGLATRL